MPGIDALRWWRVAITRLRYVLSAGRVPHPAMRRHSLVRLDPARLRRSAEAGERIVLPVGRERLELELRPAPVFDGSFDAVEFELDGTESRLEVSDVTTYAGSVPGQERSQVRLALTERTLTGYVRAGREWWFIDPLRRFRRGADRTEFVVYSTRDLAFGYSVGRDALEGEFVAAEGEPPHRAGPEIGVAMWADDDYQTLAGYLGMYWWEAQAALINNLNGIYERELGVEFRIRSALLDHTDDLSSTDGPTLLRQFGSKARRRLGDLRQVSVREATGVEIAHLTTGRNLDGDTIGVAWRPGVWGLSQQRIRFAPFSGFQDLSYQNMLLAAHEIGHNFDGTHEAAEEFCVTEFIVCLDYERTIMWPVLYSDNRGEFSDENHTRIQTNMSNGRNVNFTHP